MEQQSLTMDAAAYAEQLAWRGVSSLVRARHVGMDDL